MAVTLLIITVEETEVIEIEETEKEATNQEEDMLLEETITIDTKVTEEMMEERDMKIQGTIHLLVSITILGKKSDKEIS